MGRLETGGFIRNPEPRIDPQVKSPSKRKLLRFGAPVVLAGTAALAFIGCRSGQEKQPTPPSCSSETIKIPSAHLEGVYLVPCKRISDFTPPSGDPIERLNWLKEEVYKISDEGIFANQAYLFTVDASIVHIPEKPVPENSILIEVLNVTDLEGFNNNKREVVCELEQFFGQPIRDVQNNIHIFWDLQPAKIVSPEQDKDIKELMADTAEIQKTPGCEE